MTTTKRASMSRGSDPPRFLARPGGPCYDAGMAEAWQRAHGRFVPAAPAGPGGASAGRHVLGRWLVGALALVLVVGCSSVQIVDEAGVGVPPLRSALGRVAVLPETRWRPDQKEPEVREAIVWRALDEVFGGTPGVVRPLATYSLEPEAMTLAREAGAGTETAIFLQVQELGPILLLSLPVLWSGYSDVKLRFRAVRVPSGEVLLDVQRRRQVGGPFEVRGLWPLQRELVLTLRELLGTVGP